MVSGLAVIMAILFGQAAVIAVIVVVLRHKLEGQLVETALRHLAASAPGEGAAPSGDVAVVSCRLLKPELARRFDRAARQAFGERVKVDFSVDRALLGGAVVKAGGKTLDHSLRERLRKAGFPISR